MSPHQLSPAIHQWLADFFATPITDLVPLQGGERSKVFTFAINHQEFILRVANDQQGFLKDQYAANHFGDAIAIPKVIATDKVGDHFICISQKCIGEVLRKAEHVTPAVTQNLVKQLQILHRMKLPANHGFGQFQSNGIAPYSSWEHWVNKKETPVTKNDGTFVTWNEIEQLKPEDKELFSQIKLEINQLLNFLPTEAYLLHGDLSFGNIIIENNQITGLIDWSEAAYGDFLYDLSYLDFHLSGTSIVAAYTANLSAAQLQHFSQRMLCHKLFIGLTTMAIYAVIHYDEGYQQAKNKLSNQ